MKPLLRGGKRLLWLLFLPLPVLGQSGDADTGEVLELESRVTGNREQPKVFSVVPWQTPESAPPDYDPLWNQLGDLFSQIEREEVLRALDSEHPGGNPSASPETKRR